MSVTRVFKFEWLRRRGVLKWGFFLLVLGAISGGKHWQNQKQMAWVQSRQARFQAHLDKDRSIQTEFVRALGDLRGPSFERVREAIDSQRAGAKAGRWIAEPPSRWRTVRFVDPAMGRTFVLQFIDGHLSSAWVEPAPFVDDPGWWWAAAEAVRKIVGILATGLWLVCVIGAYREPLLRKNLGQMALALALVAMACFVFEPPERIRDVGVRIAYGPAVGGLLLLLTLPVLLMLLRRGAGAGKCLHCGYDLTGNLSGVCPECGQPTKAENLRRRLEAAADLARALEATGTEGPTVKDDSEARGDEGLPRIA